MPGMKIINHQIRENNTDFVCQNAPWHTNDIQTLFFPHFSYKSKAKQKPENLDFKGFPASGDDGDRTRDLQIANLALSQLSYIPLFTNNDEYSTIVRKMSTQEFR